MINALIRDPGSLVEERTDIYLRDCYDHAVQALDVIETYRDISSSLVEIYFASLSRRMNEIMRVLTMIATIFIPLSFIASVYGMNFNTEVSPYNLPELHWYWGYPAALGLMAAVAFILLFFFWRRGWIGDSARRRAARRAAAAEEG
jgi:magnesium transporter